MIGTTLPVTTGEQAARLVKALGSHRYVAGRQLLVHAFVLDARDGSVAAEWARTVLGGSDVDPASRDERLWRSCTEAEVASVLERFWGASEASAGAREGLADTLERHGIELPAPDPFDESREDEVFPLLIDAGWELLPLAELDAERHKGAIAAFVEPIQWEVAKFEEAEHIPPVTHLYELPAIGPRELLFGAHEGNLAEELVLYTQGNATYVDYVVRGVLRAARLG